jgi:hypothetical protein
MGSYDTTGVVVIDRFGNQESPLAGPVLCGLPYM